MANSISHRSHEVPTTFFDPMTNGDDDLACTYLDELLDEAKDGLFVESDQIAQPPPAAKQPTGLPDGQVPTMLRAHRVAGGVRTVLHAIPTSTIGVAAPAPRTDGQVPTWTANGMVCPPPRVPVSLVPDVTMQHRALDGFAVPSSSTMMQQPEYAACVLQETSSGAIGGVAPTPPTESSTLTEHEELAMRKRQERLHRNRKSAQHSRERKKQLMQTLQQRNQELEAKLGQMGAQVTVLQRQNAALRQVIANMKKGGTPEACTQQQEQTEEQQQQGGCGSPCDTSTTITTTQG